MVNKIILQNPHGKLFRSAHGIYFWYVRCDRSSFDSAPPLFDWFNYYLVSTEWPRCRHYSGTPEFTRIVFKHSSTWLQLHAQCFHELDYKLKTNDKRLVRIWLSSKCTVLKLIFFLEMIKLNDYDNYHDVRKKNRNQLFLLNF